MYDDMLRMELPRNISGFKHESSSTLIAFADDVAVLATGHTTILLEEAMNQALESVAEWMASRGLTLSVSKTEAIMLTSKRGYTIPRFFLEGTPLPLKENIRYLGIELSNKLGFGKHLECAATKAKKTITSLSRLMPNIGGPKQKKRQLLMSAAQSQMLYACPVWASALGFEKNVRLLSSPQRLMAIRVACAYRTVSTNAILVVASMLPLNLMVTERSAIYSAKKTSSDPPTKHDLREKSLYEWQRKWQESTTGSWTRTLIPDLRPWVLRTFGTVNYHITQFLTGHGCFGEKLMKFKKRETAACYDCLAPADDAEHAFFRCDRWWRQRRELEVKINAEFTPGTVVKNMLESKEKWDEISRYVVHVLKTREEEERQRQRQQQL